MKTREQLFEELSKEFENKLKSVLKESFGDVVAEYLPYVDSDVESNVYFNTFNTLEAILSGDEAAMERQGVSRLYKYSEKVRAAIYKQFKSEIENKIIEDMQRQIDDMKVSLELNNMWYNY